MNQRQFLLIVFGVIIVGLLVAVGLSLTYPDKNTQPGQSTNTDPNTVMHSVSFPYQNDVACKLIKVRECEYVVFVPRYGNAHAANGIHAGDCSNPIHKSK